MKVYLLIKYDMRDAEEEVYGVYYSIVGAKEGAKRKGYSIEWEGNYNDPKYVTKESGSIADDKHIRFAIQEWEIE